MTRRSLTGRIATFAICIIAGGMLAASSLASRGFDLRPDRHANLVTLVTDAKKNHDALETRVIKLQDDIDSFTQQQATTVSFVESDNQLAIAAAAVPVTGSAVEVTLSDAPIDAIAKGIDEDLLVVHQQDIQAVLNALWSGGAEAATIQGKRVGPTTGIKCVGNTVILDGVPYAPPYNIVGIGDQDRLLESLDSSNYLKAYRKVVDTHGLGWNVKTIDSVAMPAWNPPATLSWATPK
ncbi:MAG: DUF881 domain-containing protein [Propionibacteriaceae bacterium]